MRRFIVLSILLAIGTLACRQTDHALTLATTTSTFDSGLIERIMPAFEEQFGIEVDVIAVGTGEALRLGRAGDADLVLVHARAREDQFIAEGNGVNRRDIMCNDFVIVGAAVDPANIVGMTDAAAALQKIAAIQAPFFSRGDDSGTHIRELSLWEAAGLTPTGTWYNSVGQGMGATLTFTDEQRAYTLTDRGTFLKRYDLDLQVLVEGDSRLLNPYSIIMVNPAKHDINETAAMKFIDWLSSAETAAIINAYTINDNQLFRTDCGF